MHAKINEIKEQEGASVYQCICGSIMRKATYEWVTNKRHHSKTIVQEGSSIFVDLVLVERNHSLSLGDRL